jgi:hypothetical protein
MKMHDIVPVITSIVVLILVAILEKQSKLFAAVTATMPLTMPLALWIVYSSSRGEKVAVEKFTDGLVVGIIPTFAFAVAIWLAARAGFKLAPILFIGYAVWAATLLTILGLRRIFGVTLA